VIYALIAISITTIILLAGVAVMAIGGKLDEKYSSKLMSLRVVFQALAIAVLAIVYYLSKDTR
jgi:hypothetical protein